MRKTMGFVGLFMVISVLQVFAVSASRTINYQGRLTDSANAPVVDGSYVMTFRLYDDVNAALASAKWSETQTTVTTKNGYFNVVLGGINKFSASHLDFNNQYWLGIQVGSDSEMSPRQALTGVPMTLNYDVPVGSIIAWHKNMHTSIGMPPISDQWVECNGQTLTDSESVFNNEVIPNLNGAVEGVENPVESGGTTRTAMFLRVGTTSGVGQLDAAQGHWHAPYTGQPMYYCGSGGNLGGYGTIAGGSNYPTGNPITDGVHGAPRTSSETRPVNMSVVWIMKVK